MRNKSFPNYPDDVDYTTNSPSYYDDLARKNKLIELLSKRIWEYDEELAKRFEEWDQNLEDLPEDLKVLLQQWLDNGTLDHIINDTIFNWKLDTTIFEQFRDTTTAQLQQIMKESAVNFGVTGEGDDTQAIQLAAQSGKEVHFNSGVYEISDTIFFSENTHFIATGKTVFKITSDVDVFKLKRNNQLIGFDYDFTSVKPYTKDVFEISSKLLEDVEFNLEHRYNLQIKIQRSNFYFSNGRFDDPTGTIFHIWASKQDQFNQQWKVIGFWGVDIDEIYVTGWIGFVMRSWAYRTDQTSNTGWITGVRINKMTVNSAHWGLFGSYSLSTMDDLRYADIGNLYVTNFLFQNQSSKYMAFFTHGYKFITDAIPWDWDYYTDSAPFLIQYRTEGYIGKIFFNHGYGGLLDQMELHNKPTGMTQNDELTYIHDLTSNYVDVFKSIKDNANLIPIVWRELPLLNGWKGKIEYYKDTHNVVHMRGSINSGTVAKGTVIGTLPTGYRASIAITEIASTVDGQFANPRIQPLSISTFGDIGLVQSEAQLYINVNVSFIAI